MSYPICHIWPYRIIPDRVSSIAGNWENNGDWYKGEITQYKDAPGTYYIEYDDGDEEDDVPLRNIRLPPLDPNANPFKKVKRQLRLRGHYEVNEEGIRVTAFKVMVARYAVSEIVSAGSDAATTSTALEVP